MIDLAFWEQRLIFQQEYMEDLAFRFYKSEINAIRFNEVLFSAYQMMYIIQVEITTHRKAIEQI